MKKRLLYLIYSLLFFLPALSFAQTATHVVISELYGSGGNTGALYNSDFIELYNPTGADVDMSGWSVQYNSAVGIAAFSGITVFPSGTIIKSHGYFLVQEQSGGAVGATLPTPDIATTGTVNNFNMSGTAGKVALVSNSTIIPAPPVLPATGIVDFVGFGTTAVNFEGTGPAPAPSATTSIERKASATSTAATMTTGGSEDGKGNGYDSDSNPTDFFVAATINPQNSTSALETPPSAAVATLTGTPASLDFLATTTVGSSSVKTFSLSGSNLSASTTVTAIAPYTVSKDGTTYAAAITYTTTELATAQTVSVKFSPTTTTATSGTISLASGTTTGSVAVTGTGASATPTLTASQTSLTFASQAAGTSSAAQTFTLSGSGLSTNTTVSVAAPFAVSKDGITYSTLLTYTPVELAATQTVSVQFNPTAAGSPTGTITIASSGATSKTVALSGTATASTGGSTAATHVVISELYGSGGNTGALYNSDFIELYNPTGADVDMSGWSVQYNSAVGIAAFSGITVFPSGTIIKSHGYFLVQEQSGGAVGATLPTPDIATTGTVNNFNMSGTAGKVALVSNSTIIPAPPVLPATGIVDFVGFGTTAVNFEGTGPAPAPSATTSIERKATATSTAATMTTGGSEDGKGNGYDSDSNPTDFFVAATINPQNSTSALETPPGGAVTATPTLAVTPTSIAFPTTAIATPSAAQTFSLSAANLTASVTVTTAAPYAVSKDGLVYSTSIIYTTTELTTAKTVSVQFTPTTATSTTGSVSITSAGAVGQGVILTGTGTSAPVLPTLTVTPASLAFGNVNQGVASAAKTFTISGVNLTASATVTATAPYTISRTSATAGFGSSVSFTTAELATAQTVYVVLTPTAAGAANSTITTSSTGVLTPPSVTVTGTGVVPVLTATPTTVAFGNVTAGTTSGNQSFSLSGTNLVGTTTVTASALYQVSKDGATAWGTTLTYSTTDLATAQTVYARLLSPATAGDASGTATITTTGAGANTATVTFTATSTLAPVPTLTVTPASLTFSSFVGSSSPVQSYTLSGVNLTGNTTVTVAAPYSISTSATGTFGNTLTYTTAQLATAQTVFVKFSPTVVAVGGANNGTISNATVGGTTQSVVLTGTGVGVPTLSVDKTALTFSTVIGTTDATQSYTLTAAYITANTTVTVAAPYQVSKTATGVYGTTLTYTPADMATPQTVFVQFSPTVVAAGGVNNGSAVNASTGAVSQTVALNGTGLAVPVLTATPSTLTFAQGVGSTPVAQTFNLTGTNVTATTTLTSTAPFTISKTATGTYGLTLTYTAAEMAAAQTVYVIYTPTAIGASTGSISIATDKAVTKTVTLTGNGVNSQPTLTAIADQNVCVNTAGNIALTGIAVGPTAEVATQAIRSVTVTSNNPTLFASLGVNPVTGTTSSISYVLAAGQTGTAVVSVMVRDNGGKANGGVDSLIRSFNFTVNPPAQVSITSDALNNAIDKGMTATLTATGGTTYTWNTNATITSGLTTSTVTVRPSVTTTYTVNATNASGCATVQNITITVRTAARLTTGNVLTPNGDGVNDYWVIRNIDLYGSNYVKVYDKTGKLVFSKAGYNNDWNGYFNGSPLPQGTYYYEVDLGVGLPYKGTLSIVRD